MPAGLRQEEVFGGGQAEGGVTEELEALVVVRGVGGMLGGVGWVGQGSAQEGGIGEIMADAVLQGADRVGWGQGRSPFAAGWRSPVQGLAASRRSTVKERSLPRRSRATTAPLRSRR